MLPDSLWLLLADVSRRRRGEEQARGEKEEKLVAPSLLIGEGSSERGEASAAAAARRRERVCRSFRVRRKGCACSSMREGKNWKNLRVGVFKIEIGKWEKIQFDR